MFRLPGLGLALSLPIVMADSKNEKRAGSKNSPKLKKPSELPVYETPEELNSYEYHGKERASLEEGVAIVRKELQGALERTKETRNTINHFYETGKAHSLASVDYIMDDENLGAKVGVITVGGLAGLLVGARRGGFFKKVFYTSLGAGGTASLCYPKYASQYSKEVYENAGDYATIGYNFIVGVKPQSKESADLPEAKKEPSTIDQTPLTSEVSTQPRTFEALAQQASDITLWGFRLKDSQVSDTIVESNILEHHQGPFDPGEKLVPTKPGEKVPEEVTMKLQPYSKEFVTSESSFITPVENVSSIPTPTVKEETEEDSTYSKSSSGSLVSSELEGNDQLPATVSNGANDTTISSNAEDYTKDVDRDQNLVEAKMEASVIFNSLVKEDSSFRKRFDEDRAVIDKMRKSYKEELMLKNLFFPPEQKIKNKQTFIRGEEVIESIPEVTEVTGENRSIYATLQDWLFGSKTSPPPAIVDQEGSQESITSKAEEVVEDVIEEAVAVVVNKVAKEIDEDSKAVSEAAQTIEDISKKVEQVAEFVETTAEFSSKVAHDVSPSFEVKIKALEEVATEVEAVASEVEIGSDQVKIFSDKISKIAETVETKSAELADAKQNEIINVLEEYIEDRFEQNSTPDKENVTPDKEDSISNKISKTTDSFYSKIIYYFNPELKEKLLERQKIKLTKTSSLNSVDQNANTMSKDLNTSASSLSPETPAYASSITGNNTLLETENLEFPEIESQSETSSIPPVPFVLKSAVPKILENKSSISSDGPIIIDKNSSISKGQTINHSNLSHVETQDENCISNKSENSVSESTSVSLEAENKLSAKPILFLSETADQRLEKVENLEDIFINAMLKSQLEDTNKIKSQGKDINKIKSQVEDSNKIKSLVEDPKIIISKAEDTKITKSQGPNSTLISSQVEDTRRINSPKGGGTITVKANADDTKMEKLQVEDTKMIKSQLEDPKNRVMNKIIVLESQKEITPIKKLPVSQLANKVDECKIKEEEITLGILLPEEPLKETSSKDGTLLSKPDLDTLKSNLSSYNMNFGSKIKVRLLEDLRFIEAPGHTIVLPGDELFEQNHLDFRHFDPRKVPAEANKATTTENSAPATTAASAPATTAAASAPATTAAAPPPATTPKPKDVIVKLGDTSAKLVAGDVGQSNPEDKDMYTTRS